ncbi:MAG: YceI family protein [Steroidobacteraceae bacterium]
MLRVALAGTLSTLIATAALAAPVTYNVDPDHTFPSFEADHFNGLSIWRGKVNSTTGKVVFDREAKAGTVEVTMQMKSVDFGHDKLNEHAASPEIFDVAKFPTATFKGKLAKFDGDTPTEVQGELTLHGVTKPVTLKVVQFKCAKNPMTSKDVCGADAAAEIDREAFGVSYGKNFGFKMGVKLQISIEAVKA